MSPQDRVDLDAWMEKFRQAIHELPMPKPDRKKEDA